MVGFLLVGSTLDQALFPYYTEDKITDNNDNTGSKTILRVTRDDQVRFGNHLLIASVGNMMSKEICTKMFLGTTLVFEEINHTLELRCRYAWRTGEKFGFVKTVWIANISSSNAAHRI